jgi:hypothetical protein
MKLSAVALFFMICFSAKAEEQVRVYGFFGIGCSISDSNRPAWSLLSKRADARFETVDVSLDPEKPKVMSEAAKEILRRTKDRTAPMFVVVEKGGQIIYEGSFGENPRRPGVGIQNLEEVLNAVWDGRKPTLGATRPKGCEIPRSVYEKKK